MAYFSLVLPLINKFQRLELHSVTHKRTGVKELHFRLFHQTYTRDWNKIQIVSNSVMTNILNGAERTLSTGTPNDCFFFNISGTPNDRFLLNALKTLFSVPRVLLDLQKCILSGAIKFVSVRSSQGNLSLLEITRASELFSRKFQMQFNALRKCEFF